MSGIRKQRETPVQKAERQYQERLAEERAERVEREKFERKQRKQEELDRLRRNQEELHNQLIAVQRDNHELKQKYETQEVANQEVVNTFSVFHGRIAGVAEKVDGVAERTDSLHRQFESSEDTNARFRGETQQRVVSAEKFATQTVRDLTEIRRDNQANNGAIQTFGGILGQAVGRMDYLETLRTQRIEFSADYSASPSPSAIVPATNQPGLWERARSYLPSINLNIFSRPAVTNGEQVEEPPINFETTFQTAYASGFVGAQGIPVTLAGTTPATETAPPVPMTQYERSCLLRAQMKK